MVTSEPTPLSSLPQGYSFVVQTPARGRGRRRRGGEKKRGSEQQRSKTKQQKNQKQKKIGETRLRECVCVCFILVLRKKGKKNCTLGSSQASSTPVGGGKKIVKLPVSDIKEFCVTFSPHVAFAKKYPSQVCLFVSVWVSLLSYSSCRTHTKEVSVKGGGRGGERTCMNRHREDSIAKKER